MVMHVTHLKGSGPSVAAYLKEGMPQAGEEAEALAQYYGDGDSFWLGKLADDFGLTGAPVDMELFTQMLDGVLPDGSTPAQMHEKNRRLGEDFTLNPPKSVSIAGHVFGDTRILEANRQAVIETLDFIQKRMIYARRGHGGVEDRKSTRLNSSH